MNIVERVQNMLLHPKSEWEAIDSETCTVQGLFTGYVMLLAAIPAVSNFIGYSVVGTNNSPMPMSYGVTLLVITYVMGLASVYVLALAIDGLAHSFGGQKNFLQAMKLAAFAPTAAWIAGVVKVLPWVAILSGLGALYSLYALYLGLPLLMKVPEDQAIGYLAVVLLLAIVMGVTIAGLQFLAIPPPLRGF
jgi:hypothetical protein